MIPETKRTAVKQALQEAFGVSGYEDLRHITTGLSSALIFRIVVQGRPYLLRIVTREDEPGDPTHYFACMKVAADAGIGPRIWYISTETRISITDFIEAQPFPLDEARIKMPALIRQLHSLPPFPARVNYLTFVNGLVKKFQDRQLLPESMTGELFQLYAKVADVYPYNTQDQVASHNDLKPENFLFDGNRVWMVDWEGAFLNDRYVDLGVVANFVVRNEAEEAAYLSIYFGEEACAYQRARFFLMRQVLHMAYFTLLMLLVSAAGTPVDPDTAIPDFRDFHDRIWSGEISLAGDEARLQYAWVHMEQLSRNLLSNRLNEALEIVSGAHITN